MNEQHFVEVETKLLVNDRAAIQNRLEALSANLTVPRVFERNVRYENQDQTLTQQGIVVRLRKDHKVRLTYKEPTVQTVEDVSRRLEAEVEVSDYDAMALILERLGYQPYLIYEKYRTTYTLNDTEIVLDEMPYGDFIEVEGEPNAIEQALTELGLADEKRFNTNYIAMFDAIKEKLGLTFHDLTFANFEGVRVQPEVFE